MLLKVKNYKDKKVPYGLFFEVVNQTLYPNGHPYSWPIVGYIEDLERATLEDIKDFNMRWYGPNNAYLVVAGDVDTEEVVQLAQKYFGPIPRGAEVRKLRVPRVNLPQNKYRKFADQIYFPRAAFVYPSVPLFHKDELALQALADIMGGTNNSPFYQTFVKTEKAIFGVVGQNSSELAGQFWILLQPYPENTFAEIEEEVNELINNFEKHINENSLNQFKIKKRSSLFEQLNSVRGKASELSKWAYLLDDSHNFEKELNRIDAVSVTDILKVYNKYIKNKKSAVVDYYPLPFGSTDSVQSVNPNAKMPFVKDDQYSNLKYVRVEDDFNRSVKPVSPPAKDVKIPIFYSGNINKIISESSDGIPYIGTESNETPKVTMLITLEGGDLLIQDNIKLIGLPQLTTMMLNEGTQNYTTEEIASKLNDLGSSISFNSGSRNSSIYISCMLDKIDETLNILEEKLFRPGFRTDDFKRIKKAYRESLNDNKKSANYLASVALNEKMYGKSIRGVTETVKSIDKLKISDVQNFYSSQFKPHLASVVIVGDISESKIIPKLSFLNDWKDSDIEPINKNLPIEFINERSLYLVHKPGPQSTILIGMQGPSFDIDGEFFKSNVMNYSLGGSFNSRINLNLREDKGYTYGSQSGFTANESDGSFYLQTSVDVEVTDSALTEIINEFSNYSKNGITKEELDYTRKSIANSDALKYETPRQKAQFLSRIQRYNLDREYTKVQKQILENISIDEINKLAKKYINNEKMIIVVVGNKYSLKEKLSKFGKVQEIKLK